MKGAVVSIAIALLVGGVVGAAVQSNLFVRSKTTTTTITCRPSAPPLATKTTDLPVVLFWGNSLLFDGGWDSPDFEDVNCAQQGLTAARARGLTPLLPEIAPTAIVLAFGSVELVRDSTALPKTFKPDLTAIISLLRIQYPDSQVWVSTVPETNTSPWLYADTPALRQVIDATTGLSGISIIDLSGLLEQSNSSLHTYDGVHLTRAAYDAWSRAISDKLARIQ